MGVRLAGLARAYGRPLQGPDDEPLAGLELLEALADRRGLDVLAWIPPGREPIVGGRGCSLRAFVHSIEWRVLAGLSAGSCVDLRSNLHPSSGRMRGFAGHGFMAQPLNDSDGTLVGLSSEPVQGSPALWLQLAEWVSLSFMAEEEQHRANVEERERRLGRQTAALNHDLRNHLNLASMQLERLQAEGLPASAGSFEVQDGGGVSLADLSRSLGNARDLCARSVVGQGTLERQRIALRPRLLAQGRAARELSACGGSMRVLVRCPEDLVVRGHPSHLDRLIKNLVLNAIEASPSGSEVRLSARLVDGVVQLEVADAGRGMDAASLADWMTAGQSGGGGTGYGSASMQECLSGLGADIEVASTPGAGTRVSVRLAAVHGSQAPLVLLVESPVGLGERRRALLAEEGLAVVEAGSVEEARTWLGDPSLERVLIPRGLKDPGLQSFLEAAQRAGVEVQLLGVLGPARALERKV